jgi:hypothetical protein
VVALKVLLADLRRQFGADDGFPGATAAREVPGVGPR